MSSNTDKVVPKSNERVGQQIRDLRKSKGITQSYLAEQTGKSLGYISQLERGFSSVSIPVLQKISEILGVNITWFFHFESEETPEESNYVVRRDNRRQLTFSGSGLKEELLSPRMNGDFLMILSTIAPGAETDKKSRKRVKDEAGYVQLGQVEMHINDEIYILNAGDSFSISPEDHYQFRNTSAFEKVVIIWVLPPSSF